MTRVLYVQHTNPAGYPPLEHSARLLAEAGAEVAVLGTAARGMEKFAWPERSRITVTMSRARERGLGQKIDYIRYALRVLRQARAFQPDWIYVSDTRAAPIGLATRRLASVRIVYHEHDEPARENPSVFMRWCLRARKRLALVADEVVVPNRERGMRLARESGRERPVRVIWNCPMSDDVGASHAPPHGALRILYQGSITTARLPLQVIDALALVDDAELVVIGYETIGSIGHVAALEKRAASLGISNRLRVLGTIPLRSEMLAVTATCHVGLALLPIGTTEVNEANMVGASNKSFDYMARGLGLIVSDMPAWNSAFVDPGYARACDPEDPKSIASAISWYEERRESLPVLGDRARAKIATEWNYEAQFAPLLSAMLEGPTRRSS